MNMQNSAPISTSRFFIKHGVKIFRASKMAAGDKTVDSSSFVVVATMNSAVIFCAVTAVFIVLNILYRKLRSGVKPWFACALDALLAVPHALGLGLFASTPDIVGATQSAMKATGLTDFGGNGSLFIELYETTRRVGLRKCKARLSPSGFVIHKRTLQKRMETRLKLVDFMARHPTVAATKFSRSPIFVIGFPRTGTTFLHEVLGLHAEVRMHRSWEQIAPVPTTDDETPEALRADRLLRHARHRREFDTTVSLAGPHIQAIHRVEYDASEECTTPCGVELPWNPPNLTLMACAADEVLPLGAGQAFSFYRRFLQLLSWQCPDDGTPTTWMLKCPFHLPYLEDLHAEFPTSTVVWTHRHPVECVGSCCSLFEAILLLTVDSWTLDRKALGAQVLNYIRICLSRALKSIAKLEKTLTVVHVKYTETTGHTLEACEKVCAATGLPFTSEYQARVKAYLEESNAKRTAMASKGKEGGAKKLHAYSLEDFGLNEEDVAKEFKTYIEKYC